MYVDGRINALFWVGGITNSPATSSLNFIIASGISVFCRVAVNCFILITGYFLCADDSEIQLNKIINPIKKHYKKMWFYSVFIFVIACLFDNSLFSLKELSYSMTPIMSNQWWFMTIFIFLLCIKPFLAKLLFYLSEKELKILLLSVAFFDIIQSILGKNGFSERGTGVLHCTFMLVLGYGIRKLSCLKFEKIKALLIYVFSCLVVGVIALCEKKIFHSNDAVSLYYNSPLIVIASIGFMNIFLSNKFKGKWVSKISPHVIVIYLINDHPIVRENVWIKILHCDNFYSSNFMILHWIFTVILFVVIGIVMDYFISNIKKITRIKEG